MPQAGVPRAIWFVVFPGFELLDLGGPLCAFNLAKDFHQAAYEIRVVSVAGGLVSGSSGVAIDTVPPAPTIHLDTLIVVGAPTTETADLVRTVAPRARRKASVCTGAFLLAAAGVLEGHRATTHWRYAGELQRRHPGLKIDADRIFVREDDIWMCFGMEKGPLW
jgi:transcriptional regulator GlxA family with amidase domain